MSFKDALLSMYDDCGNHQHSDIRNAIISDGDIFDFPPTHESEPSRKMVMAIAFIAYSLVKKFYGESDTIYNYDVVLGSEHPQKDSPNNSRVAPVANNPNNPNNPDNPTWALYIGQLYVTWEQVFYEICHESVHLLNPAKNADLHKVQRLDEGVAVKFAEAMYKKYITPYTTKPPMFTPVRFAILSQYTESFNITNKISDEALKLVREKFGSFWSVDDDSEFIKIIGDCLTDNEANYILEKFDYNTEM